MKSNSRKRWKRPFGMSYFGNGDSLESAEDDPIRQSVIRAYKDPKFARQLLEEIVAQYWDYKLYKFDFPIESLDPDVIQQPKAKVNRSLQKFLPELHLDFLIQCLSDYLSGENADTAFGINPPVGRKKLPQEVAGGDELAIAKFFDSRLVDGHESALSQTLDHFGFSKSANEYPKNAKRIKFCHEKYRNMTGWALVVKHDLQVCQIEGQFYPLMRE